MGAATAEWCDENGCSVANTGDPTYITEGTATAPDVTITSGPLLVNKWRTTNSIGRCGHKAIMYNLELADPHSQWPRPRADPRREIIPPSPEPICRPDVSSCYDDGPHQLLPIGQ